MSVFMLVRWFNAISSLVGLPRLSEEMDIVMALVVGIRVAKIRSKVSGFAKKLLWLMLGAREFLAACKSLNWSVLSCSCLVLAKFNKKKSLSD